MTDRREQLHERLESLQEELRVLEASISEEKLRAHIGEEYVRWLESLTDSEAIEHLNSVDESRVKGAYLILSRKLDPPALADTCMSFLRRPDITSRLTGILGIGSCLKRTRNADACRALAHIVRNPEEDGELRNAAFWSMVLIDGGKTKLRFHEPGDTDYAKRELDNIDWGFVDSYLKE